MAKQQVLNIEPQQELKFLGPFNCMSSTFMTLSNPTKSHVIFKIKTTAPKKYCVRPNSGIVDPKGTVHIQVCLQPFCVDPNEKNKHKFMVQSMMWDPKGELSQEDAWREAKPENLMDTKLKCVFEFPVESGSAKKVSTSPTSQTSPQAESESPRFVSGDSASNDGEQLLEQPRKEVEFIMSNDDNLREENLALKEELSLLRKKLDSQKTVTNWSQHQAQPGFLTPLIVLAILTGLVGIILGKFLL